jgi:predicted RNA-binding protein YlxR (DUF448 family)
MTRMVRAADGSIVPDPTGKARGRGTYVCDQATCQDPVASARAVERALGSRPAPSATKLEVNNAAT